MFGKGYDEEDENKSAKEKVLQEIMGMMDSHMGSKFGKKPEAIEVSMTKAEPIEEDSLTGREGDDEVMGKNADEIAEEEEEEDAENEDEYPSEHDRGMISALYNKYCK